MALNYRQGIDMPQWESMGNNVSGQSITGSFSSSGMWMAEDMRNNDYAHPIVYYNSTLAIFRGYWKKQNAWMEINGAFGAGGTFGPGSCAVFVPDMSPSGTIAAGATTTTLTLTTALPASVLANQLANRGDGMGFIIRIKGNAAGSSGKTEERRVIGNTSGTTPQLILDSPLTFTPILGDGYEFLSGSYCWLGTGGLGANQFRKYDCLTSSYSSLATTNLIATVPATGNFMVAMASGYVPHNRKCGEGQLVGAGTYNDGDLGCLTATGSAAGTLTGEAAAGDYNMQANTFRNYQIRIVEDTAIPTAVGQVRVISSHTGGSLPIYTLSSSWSVTPSTTCKYVIEHYGDRIIGFMGGTTTIYNYSISGNTWSTAIWAARGSSAQSSGAFGALAFGVCPNSIGSLKSGNIVCFRGGTTTTPDILDIAGAATGSWTNAATLVDFAPTAGGYDSFTASDFCHHAYNPHTQDGKYMYFFTGMASSTTNTTARSLTRIDLASLKIEKIQGMPAVSGSSGLTSKFAFVSLGYDGTTKIASYYTARPMQINDYWRLLLTM